MTREDYCSYEVAKLLKEKGFDEYCRSYYELGEPRVYVGSTGVCNNTIFQDESNECIARPTHQMALRWLRENNIIITPQPEYFSCDRCKSWGIDIWAFDNYEKLPGDFPTYEQAVEAALKYCLTKLI